MQAVLSECKVLRIKRVSRKKVFGKFCVVELPSPLLITTFHAYDSDPTMLHGHSQGRK